MEVEVKYGTTILETRRIRLREIQHEDLETIFQWRNKKKFRCLLHHNTNTISYNEFCKEFFMDSECYKYQFLIEKKDGGVPVGLTYVYTFSEQYRSCFINLFIDEPFEKKGYGIDAFVLFALFLFQHAGLKKLFATVFDFNDHSLSCIRHIGMRELVGNITKVPERGNLLCFAADQSIVPNLARINKILSIHKSSFFNY
jgi:RimJ/RimL family protein N-acetyltransferase